MKHTRRHFIRNLTASGLALGWYGGYAANPTEQLAALNKPQGKRPRNLIFLVADGMNHGTLTLADCYAKAFVKRDSQWVQLYQEGAVTRALMNTASANSLVTDSAAAGSAWGGGKRVSNRAINVNADGSENTPMWLLAKQAGKLTGLVTTTRLTHATPASFVANVPHRDREQEIAQQYLEREVDVLLGGGNQMFSPHVREDGIDIWGSYRKNGYTVVKHREGLLAQTDERGRLLGVFADSHLPYTIDRNHQSSIAEQVPTLAEMMSVTLERMVKHDQGFVLQVEGGRIDHAGHANDAGAIVHEQLAFDECIAVARVFARSHPDTLVIVTTDHGTGGCQINGMGEGYADTNRAFASLANFTGSWQSVHDYFGKTQPTVETLRSKLQQTTGLSIDADKVKSILDAAARDAGEYAITNQLGALVMPHTSVGWTSRAHTGEAVEFCAFGPGSDTFKAYFENWELHGMLRRVLQI